MARPNVSGVADKRTASPGAEAVVIDPAQGWRLPDARELWRFRHLLYFLVWRTIKVRYKQTAIGAAWAVLQPLVAMVVFSLIFCNLLGVPSDGIPYPIFAYVALPRIRYAFWWALGRSRQALRER